MSAIIDNIKTVSVGSLTIEQKRRRRIAALSSIAGTTIEWYDYFLYGAVSALIFNKVFFTNLDPITGTIASLGTFAVGFIARPFGAAFFGQLGDRVGRKSALIWTLAVMGVATVGIGFLPTFNEIGLWAALLLTIMRLLQGFAAGGEWGGAVLITFENSHGVRRGFMAALPGMGIGIGSLLSTGSVALLTAVLSPEQFLEWGWRIPFIASAVIIIIGVVLRKTLDETEEFLEEKKAAQNQISNLAETRSPIREMVSSNWRELLVVMGARIGENGCYYLFGTFVIAYANIYNLNTTTVLSAVSAAFATEIIAIPFFGWVSDKLGRRTVYGFGAVFLMGWSWVFFSLLDTNDPVYIFMAIMFGIVLGHSAMFGAQSAFFAELFPTKVRYSGLALGHAVGAIIGGGLAPMAAGALIKIFDSSVSVSLYACLMGAITLVTLVASRSMKTS